MCWKCRNPHIYIRDTYIWARLCWHWLCAVTKLTFHTTHQCRLINVCSVKGIGSSKHSIPKYFISHAADLGHFSTHQCWLFLTEPKMMGIQEDVGWGQASKQEKMYPAPWMVKWPFPDWINCQPNMKIPAKLIFFHTILFSFFSKWTDLGKYEQAFSRIFYQPCRQMKRHAMHMVYL